MSGLSIQILYGGNFHTAEANTSHMNHTNHRRGRVYVGEDRAGGTGAGVRGEGRGEGRWEEGRSRV